MIRLPRRPILCVLAITIMGGSIGARASTYTQTIPVVPAPPLTPAQIDRLKHVTSWDLEFTGRRQRSA